MNMDVTATIAIVDTGVDFNNPDLKPYLLEGKNIVNERKSAQDDNGHGTAVAGIIASVAKAGETSSGLGRWKGRILPVKALDASGSGNEEKLTQGIRYAVNQGADIIVLSLGLRRDAIGLREAVALAESKRRSAYRRKRQRCCNIRQQSGCAVSGSVPDGIGGSRF